MFRLFLDAGFGDVMMAIVSLDIALWSIKCQVLSVLLCTLIGGAVRDKAPAYAMTRDYSKDPSY